MHCTYLPRNLHSFPTRRSSDLLAIEIVSALAPVALPCVAIVSPADVYPAYFVPENAPSIVAPVPVTVYPRSEEHTSELQSHVNLVCRLLLEKKKSSNTTFKLAK